MNQMLRAFPQQGYAKDDHWGATVNVVTRREVIHAVGPLRCTCKAGDHKAWERRVGTAGWNVGHHCGVEVVYRGPSGRPRALCLICACVARGKGTLGGQHVPAADSRVG